jgi:catechol 2,3-dioxygenase-like lactoylglutathione lyase family enzyme
MGPDRVCGAASLRPVQESEDAQKEELMVARIDRITIDCADPQRITAFWGPALGYELRDNDGNLSLFDPAGRGLEIGFQQVPERKVVKNRLHLDLLPVDGDWNTEVERLEALGAERVQFFDHDPTQTWWVMRDPEGNEFCIVWLHADHRP